MALFDSFKTPIFADINDAPREATSEQASNGSDLIAKINGLCDEIATSFSDKDTEYDYAINFNLTDEELINSTESNVFNSFTGLISVLSQENLFQDLTIELIGTSNGTETLNFNELNFDNNVTLNFKGASLNSSIYYASNTSEALITNVPAELSISFDNINFLLEKFFLIRDFTKIKFKKCSILNSSGFSGNLISIINMKDVEFDNCYISNVENNGSGKLIFANINDVITLKNVVLNCSFRPLVEFKSTHVEFLESFKIVNVNLESDTNLITVTIGSIAIGAKTNLNLTSINSNFSNAFIYKGADNVTKSYSFFFRQVNSEIIPLILIPAKNFKVERMYIKQNGTNADFSLLRGTEDLPKRSNQSTEKSFRTDSDSNLFRKGYSDVLNLQVFGTGTDVLIQIICLEY